MPDETATDVLRIDDRDHVRILTLNRPERLNAFNPALLESLHQALAAAAENDDVHVVLLTGSGRAFSSGADLSDMTRLTQSVGAPSVKGIFDSLQDVAERFPKPLIAAVNGLAVGLGFTILGYCDFCFVGESAKLRTPFSQLGLSPEASSSYLFPLRMGWAAAARALMLGDWFSAQDLVDCGMAQEVVPDDQLMAVATNFAARLAAAPLQSLLATKALMLEAHLPQITAARIRESEILKQLVGSPANIAALKAFAVRRSGGS